MAWGKSKSESDGSPPDQAAPDRDKILLALATQTEQLNERLTRLEDRFDAAMSNNEEIDTDLRDLQVNSARLAFELQRVTEELQTDIDDLASVPVEEINRPAEIDLTTPSTVDKQNERYLSGETDPTLRLPGARGQSGWLPRDD